MRASSVTTLLAALLALAQAGCPSWQFIARPSLPDLPTPLPTGIVNALAAVNASLFGVLDKTSLPGFAVSVWYNSREVLAWGGGIADKSTGRGPPAPATDLFRIASNTKLYTCMLAEIFEQLGYIASLDDLVRLYAPDFKGPVNIWGDGAEVTFRRLMSHTAGLPDSLPGGGDWGNVTTASVWEGIAAVPMTVPLSTLPMYSNLGISTLGHILAEYVAPADQRGDIGPLIERYILTPLGLTGNTGYAIPPSVAARLIPAYFGDGTRVPPVEDLGWSAPCGTMWSTVSNLAAFHQATAAAYSGATIPGLALTPERARRWLQPVSLQTPDVSVEIGQPWETIAAPGGFVVRTKSGTLVGYSTKSALVPELRLSFAVAFNGAFGDWYVGNALLVNISALLVPAFVEAITPLQPPRTPGPHPLDYVGTYAQSANAGNTAVVAVDALGQLTLSSAVLGDAGVLEAVNASLLPDAFRMFQDPTAVNCEHVAMADSVWGWPVLFQRSGGGNVTSLRIVNWGGEWNKT